LDISKFNNKKIGIKEFSEEEKKEIVFVEVVDEKMHHTTILNSSIEPNYQSVIGFFVQRIMKELRLFGCYDILFGKVKDFVCNYLFINNIDLNDSNILRNLSETEVVKTIIESFKKGVNDLTVQDVGDTEIKNYLKVSSARPFVVTDKKYLLPKKSVFNKIVGDSDFELEFADFLEGADDVISFSKNYTEIGFKIDYKNASGAISSYYPDFFVKTGDKTIYIVETKGREDLNDIEKIKRLAQWCEDASERQKKNQYKMLYVKQEEWDKYMPKDFKQLVGLVLKA
jgi:type III restriction enzyme